MKKTIVISMVILFIGLAMLASGCAERDAAGDAAEETAVPAVADDDDEVGESEEESVIFDTWKAPVNLQEVVAVFKEIRHSVTQDGMEVLAVHYRYEGSETLSGVQTDKITVDWNEEKIEAWLDSAGEIKKIKIGGEEIPDEMAAMLAEPMLANLMMPFQIAQGWDVRDLVSAAHQEPGVTVSRVKSGEETIGDLRAIIYTYEVTVEPPAVPAGEGSRMQWRIADFGEFQTIVSWEMLEGGGGESNLDFKIDRIVLR